ncbi:MAG TPA: hypothetical protein VHO27_01480 [Angustibacter sp.]|nr:hypothetical protein [Angustibacter sp.]
MARIIIEVRQGTSISRIERDAHGHFTWIDPDPAELAAAIGSAADEMARLLNPDGAS